MYDESREKWTKDGRTDKIKRKEEKKEITKGSKTGRKGDEK